MRAVCVRSCLVAVLFVVAVHASGCARSPAPPREFALRGQVLAVRSPTDLLIKHEDIEGFMPAMTMPYQVRDPQLTQGRAPGDLIDCPLLDRRFADVQRLVKEDPVLTDRVRLVSVSFDPDADSPAVLSTHATRLGADPHLWHFATAPRDVVDRFAASFGVSVIREADATITHNVRTTVVDPDGKVLAIHTGMEWTPEEIAADLRRALSAR